MNLGSAHMHSNLTTQLSSSRNSTLRMVISWRKVSKNLSKNSKYCRLYAPRIRSLRRGRRSAFRSSRIRWRAWWLRMCWSRILKKLKAGSMASSRSSWRCRISAWKGPMRRWQTTWSASSGKWVSIGTRSCGGLKIARSCLSSELLRKSSLTRSKR